MEGLFKTNLNWPVFFILVIALRFAGFTLGWTSYLALVISLFQFILLFNSIGSLIPVRYLLGSFMCVQFLIGPSFAYAGLDKYQYFKYVMQIPANEYFLYAIPAIVLFIIGLHIHGGKLHGEFVNIKKLEFFVTQNPKLPYLFIIIGFIASLASTFFNSGFAFVLYLVGSFKFLARDS